MGDELKEINVSSFKDSGYYNDYGNWKNGLLYLGKWIIGSNGRLDEYVIKADIVGIAADVFLKNSVFGAQKIQCLFIWKNSFKWL